RGRRARQADVGAARAGVPRQRGRASGARPAERLGAADRDDVRRVDLDHRRLTDQRDGQHETGDAILAQELAANPGERAADDFDVHALGEERVGVVLERGGRKPLDGVDLRVGNGLGRAAATDEAGDADDGQDAQPLDQREAGEAVTGKEWKGDLLPSVLPVTPAIDQWQEGLAFTLNVHGVDRLLVTGAR